MFCEKCGAKLEDGASFCMECGNPVNGGNTTNTNQQPIYQQTANQQPNYQQTANQQPNYQQTVNQQPNYQQMVNQQPVYQQAPKQRPPKQQSSKMPGGSKEPKKSNIVPICIVLAIAIILLGGLGIWGILTLNDSDTAEKKTTETAKTEESSSKTKDDANTKSTETGEEDSGSVIKPETPAVTETPTPEPTSSVATASLVTYDAALTGQYTQIKPVSGVATSSIQQDLTENGPMMMVDGDEMTNWEEGVDGDGIGERATFQFDQSREIKYMTFKLGNWKTDRYYAGNNKPETMTLSFDNQAFQVTFPSAKQVYMVELSQPVTTSSFTLQIDSVYKGSQWEDTVITDICFYGK